VGDCSKLCPLDVTKTSVSCRYMPSIYSFIKKTPLSITPMAFTINC
jgi:hypothetical protein